jgi:shikimate kinase
MDFADLDTAVAEKAGRSISQIFACDGEPVFRRIEASITADIAGRENTVIACGGGVVLDQANIEVLKGNAVIIYLSAEPSIMLRRVLKSREKRPLLQMIDPAAAMDDLLKYRKPLYETAADLTVNTSDLGIDGVVHIILAEIRKDESFNFPQRD